MMCASPCRGPTRVRRWSTTFALVAGVALVLLARRSSAQTATLTIPVAADTYVDASSASKNFGTAKTLLASASPVRIIYLRFVVSGVAGRVVQGARLKLGVVSGGAPGGTVHRITNTTWSETTVTSKTRPAVDGPGLATLGKVATGQVVTFDLGATAITGDGTVSLAIDTTGAAVTYASAQATSGQKPALELTVALPRPTVTITQPPAGAGFYVGDPVTLQASARDWAGTDLGAGIAWSSSLAGPLGSGALVTTRALGQGTQTITAAVTDGNGLTGASQTSVTVAVRPPTNTPPLVTITAPTTGQVLPPRRPVTFTGTASDLEDGGLSDMLLWTSDRDGVLGPGRVLSRVLSTGTHRITAWAIDSGGVAGNAAVGVDVGTALEFPVTADASVDSLAPGTSFGTGPLLRLDANPVRIPYLRFDVSGVGAVPVLHAFVRLQVDGGAGADGDSGGVLRPVADASWQESALTYDARPPAAAPALATVGRVALGQSVDFDTGATVTGDGTYAFALTTTSTDEVDYRAREGGPAPKLVVVVAGTPPVVTIAEPADQVVMLQGTPVTFRAQAVDGTGVDLGPRIQWTSSRDGALGAGGTVVAAGLSLGTHVVTAVATDDSGLRGQAQVTVRVRGPNRPPVLTVNAPASGTSVPAGTPLGLDATAVDEWDGDLTGRIQWRDSRDGALGTGGTRTVMLTEGVHALTAAVTDSDGATASTDVPVSVTPTAPVVTLLTPASGTTVFTPATVTLSATAVDATDGNVAAGLRWTSSRDGVIGTGATFTSSRLSVGQHVITAAVADRGGLVGSAQSMLKVRTPNVAPAVAIAAPLNGATLLAARPTLLAATAVDAEDADLAPALQWTSSRDGALGTGALLLVPGLSAGAHVLTASATDRDGATTSAAVTVTVVPATLSIGAVADTYVDGGSTSAKFGTATTLWADASPVRQAFLRFTVAGIGGLAVQQAHLRLTAASTSTAPSDSGGTLATITSSAWSEASTTYKTRPALDGAALGTQGKVLAGQLVDFDVGRAVQADGTYNFALTTASKDEVVYASREATTGKPQLLVTLAQNTAPAVHVTAPSPNAVVPAGSTVTFTAVATDAESGDVSAAVRWSSSRDGDLGSGASVTATPSTGLHTITATVTDPGGKTGTTSITLKVDAPPTLTILAPAAGGIIAPGASLGLTATATDPEDGVLTPAIVWTSSRDGVLGAGGAISASSLTTGTHTLTATVTDSGGLSAARSTTVTVNALPVVRIVAPAAGADVLPGTPLALSATATDAEDGDLGAALVWTSSRDGTLGTGATVSGVTLSSGTHAITAAATDRNGQTGRAAITVVVNAAPVVAITAPATGTVVRAGTPLTLAATARDAEDGDLGSSIVWSSSRDGILGHGATLASSVLAAGAHVLTAFVTDRGGKTASATVGVTVDAPPQLTITAPAGAIVVEPGAPVTLAATATDTEDGDLGARVVWTSSRDGALGSGSPLTVSGLTSGVHAITAAVIDAAGSTASAAVPVTVNATPVVTITAPLADPAPEPGTPLVFAASATDVEDGDLGAHVIWTSSRDGVLGSGASLTVAGLSSGTHVVTASVTDTGGKTAQASVTVTIDASPVVTITAPGASLTVSPGTSIPFAATAIDAEDGDLGARVVWSSSRDGQLGTGSSLALGTLSAGAHLITASVTDVAGKRASASVGVLVNEPPAVRITAPAGTVDVEPGTSLAFAATATDAEDGDLGAAIVWTSSRDGVLGVGPTLVTGGLSSGTHTIAAAVTDHDGGDGRASVSVTVNATPVVQITAPAGPLDVEPGTPVALAATATDAEDGDVGDRIVWSSSLAGVLGTGARVTTTALRSGTHVLTATVTDAGGKTARAAVTVTVDAAPVVTLQASAEHVIEPGAEIVLGATADDAEDGDLTSGITWTSSRDGALGRGGSLAVRTLTDGTHVITATVTDASGKTASASFTVVVDARPQIGISTPAAGMRHELGAPIVLSALADDVEDGDLASGVVWTSSRDGVLGTGSPLVVSTLTSGRHDLRAAVVDAPGERAEAVVTIVVDATPAVRIVTPADGAVIEPGTTLEAVATDVEDGDLGAGIEWTSDRDGRLGTGAVLQVGGLRSGAHVLTAAVTDAAGATASAALTVRVDVPPRIVIVAPVDGDSVEPGVPVVLAATVDDPDDSALGAFVGWTSDLDGGLGTGARIVVDGLRSGTHVVTASIADSAGRTAASTVTITVDAPPVVVITAPADGTIVSPGTPLALAATARDPEDGDLAGTVVWTSDLDGPLGTGAIVAVLRSGVHHVTATVTDGAGRSASATEMVVVNATPTVAISAPVDGTVFAPDDAITFAGAASDVEDGDLAGRLAWASDLDGPLGTGATIQVTGLRSGTHRISATATDQMGVVAQAVVNVVVDAPPAVSITAPAAGSVFDPGAPVALTAVATDREDGDLGAGVTWTSDLDGLLGTGPTIAPTTLRAGVHRVTATVVDGGGRSATATVALTVDTPPTIALTGPASGSAYHPRDPVTFTATANDVEDGSLDAAVVWTSDRDGRIGTGAVLTVATLSPGAHAVTATVTDTAGRATSSAVAVTVGPLFTLRGPQAGAFTHTVGLDGLIDALGAMFFPGPKNLYPINVDGGDAAILRGGAVLGQYDRALTWDDMHALNNAGVAFSNARFTVDGVRIDNVTDGLRPKSGGGFVVRNVWGSYIRDDCIENDHLNDGLVEDTLFDGCYEGFSARPSQAIIDSGYSGVGKVWTIRNTLVRLQPMPDPPQGTADGLGTNTFFKWHKWTDPANSLSPKLALENNVFMAERVGLAGGTRMGVPPSQIASCANNVIVWLGPGPFPGVLPPGCFTITTDRRVWDDAVAAWHARHPDVGN